MMDIGGPGISGVSMLQIGGDDYLSTIGRKVDFSKYAFYMDFIHGKKPQDMVSKNYLTTVIPGIRYLDDETPVHINVPSIDPVKGLRGQGARTVTIGGVEKQTVTEVSEGPDHEYGNFLRLADFPKLVAALGDQGELQIEWTPGYEKNVLAMGVGYPLLSVRAETFDILFPYVSNDGTSKIYSADDTNSATKNLQWVSEGHYEIVLCWGVIDGIQKMQLTVNDEKGALASFDGSFDPTTLLNFFFQNTYTNYIKYLHVLKEPVSWNEESAKIVVDSADTPVVDSDGKQVVA